MAIGAPEKDRTYLLNLRSVLYERLFLARVVSLQAAAKAKYQDEQLPPMLEKIENILKQNKGGDGWFVGDDVSPFSTITGKIAGDESQGSFAEQACSKLHQRIK